MKVPSFFVANLQLQLLFNVIPEYIVFQFCVNPMRSKIMLRINAFLLHVKLSG